MTTSTDLLAAFELIKRAELIQERAAAVYAQGERAKGNTATTDVLRSHFKEMHPYMQHIPRALQEAKDVAAYIATTNP